MNTTATEPGATEPADPEPTPELHPGFSSPGTTATAWQDVAEILNSAEIFWISTVRPDGRPHVAPLPAMWLDGALHFATGFHEQKGRNLDRNPHCVLTTGSNSYRHGLDVVIEGCAIRVTDRDTLEQLARMWRDKLDWPFDVADQGFQHHEEGRAPHVAAGTVVPVFAVRPTKILAFGRDTGFTQTRYLLGDPV